MKRRILTMVLVLTILGIPMVCEARNEDVTVSSASVTSSGATVSGTTNAPAVMVQVRDANNEIVVMASFAVKDGAFSGNIPQNLTPGATYQIYVADYEGGPFVTEEVTAPNTPAPSPQPASSGSGGGSSSGTTAQPESTEPTPIEETITVTEQRTYTVVKGDTLNKIAAKLQVPLADLLSWNTIKNRNLIYPGQPILYYVTVTKTVTKGTAQISENDPVPEETADGTYVVEKGDTLSRIARKLKLSLKQLLSKNTFKNINLIFPGQKIKY
ncbi:MAG: LysM peptidoglycan-binding domain-containing protein [Lachnospiraceae bacterium]|nr:LysM peptidoglycan-binding domain-containing protein [Lachnospiraceae bacterium]